MRAAVPSAFLTLSTELEGDLDFFYLDVRDLVTIGLGLLADPLGEGPALSFYWPKTGAPATRADVAAAWWRVKQATALARGGGAHYADLCAIRATKASLAVAATAKLAADEKDLRRFFPGWDDFPAPGQLLVLSMAWAMGAEEFSKWPHFTAAANDGNWTATAVPRGAAPESCQMDEARQNASFRLRNRVDLELAKAAAFAVDHELEDELDIGAILARAKAA